MARGAVYTQEHTTTLGWSPIVTFQKVEVLTVSDLIRRGFRCPSASWLYWQEEQSLGTGREAISGYSATILYTGLGAGRMGWTGSLRGIPIR